MKNTIKLLVMLFAFNVNAQTVKPSEQYYTSNYNDLDNIYFKDVNHIYDKFLGTWEYNSGPHYLKIVVTKMTKVEQGVMDNGERFFNKRQYLDMVSIEYIYKYNGVTVYNVFPPYQEADGTTLFIDGSIIDNPRALDLSYTEPSGTPCGRNKIGSLKLTYIPNGNSPQLKWFRTDRNIGTPDSSCTDIDRSAYKIPANIVLNKI